VGDDRAGRLVAPDEGTHEDDEEDLLADDVGIAGAAASAEEAAVHVVPGTEEEAAVQVVPGTEEEAAVQVVPGTDEHPENRPHDPTRPTRPGSGEPPPKR
jgi:hypothetical protein